MAPAPSLRSLELIYRNAESEEELDVALEYHNISKEDFFKLAHTHGWEPSPIAIKNLAYQINTTPLLPVDSSHIEESNKAAVRRLHGLIELAVTKFQYAMMVREPAMSISAMLDQLETITKIREKITKLEYPLYGLSTMEPVAPVNPINIFLDPAQENSPPPPGEPESEK